MSFDSTTQKLFDTLPTMLLVLRTDGALAFANQYFWEFTGVTVEQRDSFSWRRTLSEDDAAKITRAAQLAISFSMQVQIFRADGSQGWVEFNGSAQPAAGIVICVVHDITIGKHAELSSRAQAHQFRLLADNLPVQIAYYEVSTFKCLFANRAYAEANGLNEANIVGKTFAEVIGEKATEFIQPMVDRMVADGVTVTYDRPSSLPNGLQRWLEVSLIPHKSEAGVSFAAFVLITDITKHRLAEIETRESELRLDTFMNASAEGIVFHQGGIVVDANPAACRIVGRTFEQVVNHSITDFIPVEHRAEIMANVVSGQQVTYESTLWDADHNAVPVEMIGRTLTYRGVPTRMTVLRDLRDRHQAQARISFLAHHDSLTGLPNRARLVELLDMMLLTAKARSHPLALLFVDLDHFKRVNDSLGHEAGDELLRQTAVRLRATVRDSDVVGRFASDEFVIVMPNMNGVAHAEEVARRILKDLQEPLTFNGRQLQITPSIGIAMYPGDGATADELLSHADSAMYAAKQGGRANFQFFSIKLANEAAKQYELEQELTRALQEREFVLHFQPIWSATGTELVGAEALIRWQHPQRGLLGPNYFIEFAEERRLIVKIGEWVIREAARWSRQWLSAGLPLLPIAVNLATSQFRGQDFLPTLDLMLEEFDLPPGWMEFELTERMLMDDVDEVRARLNQIKAKGIHLSIDDFGTGYSSLVHLKALPIDKLKIDRSFVKDLPGDRDSAAITMAILQMAHSLQIGTVAEGVETQAQLDMLSQLGCERIQGFLLAKPMPGEQIAALLQSKPVRSLPPRRPLARRLA